jgi:hypothetical protein
MSKFPGVSGKIQARMHVPIFLMLRGNIMVFPGRSKMKNFQERPESLDGGI